MRAVTRGSIVAVAVAMALIGGACGSDDNAAQGTGTTTATSSETSIVTLDADQAERLQLAEGDEITVGTAPTTVVEPTTQSANEQFIADTLNATGFAEDADQDDFPEYSTVQIPGGYTAEAPTAWLSDVASDHNSITLNYPGWDAWSSSVNIRIDSGDPGSALSSYLADTIYDRNCTTEGPQPYDDGRIAGLTQVYRACGPADAVVIVSGTIKGDPAGKVIVLDSITAEPRDVRAIARLMATINPAS